MGVFIFGTANITSGVGLLAKFLVIIGGLARMTTVPQFVKSRTDTGNDIEDSWTGAIKSYKDIYDTVTLKKLKSTAFINKKNEEKTKNIQSLRKKHGQRFVKGLS